MLAHAALMAFVAARDLPVAGAFYGGTLGLRRIACTPHADVYEVSGSKLCVIREEDAEPTGKTVLGWNVDDLAATVARLRKAGVEFIRYTTLEQDADDAWTSPSGARTAWFVDPEGHVLSVTQLPS